MKNIGSGIQDGCHGPMTICDLAHIAYETSLRQLGSITQLVVCLTAGSGAQV